MRQPSTRLRRWPPVLAFALVVLAMSALVGLIGGAVLITRQPLIALASIAFGVVCLASAWSLGRGERRGYWAAVVLLAFVGGAPTVAVIAAGSPGAAVFLAPPLVLVIIMLRRSVREQLIRAADPTDQLPGAPGAAG